MRNHGILSPTPRGFTLVELLVVIAIVGTLTSLLLPAVQAAREAGRRASCTNNLKQIGLAYLNYENAHKYFSLAYSYVQSDPTVSSANVSNIGWPSFVLILPFLEENNVYQQINTRASFFNSVNLPPPAGSNAVFSTVLSEFLCPSSPEPTTIDYTEALQASFNNFSLAISYPPGMIFGRTDYAPDAGVEAGSMGITITSAAGIIAQPTPPASGGPVTTPTRFKQITDGASKTILLVEDAGRPAFYSNRGRISDGPNPQGGGAWADPLTYIATNGSLADGSGFVPGPCALECSNDSEIFSMHVTGSNVVFGDGAVYFLAEGYSMPDVAALVSKAGNDFPPILDR